MSELIEADFSHVLKDIVVGASCLYINYVKAMKQSSSVATFRLQSSGSELVRVLCVFLSSTSSSTSSHSE
jgi:hypothetical protein